MTPEEFKTAMEAILERESRTSSCEETHKDADKLLCKALEDLGYGEGVEIFWMLYRDYA